MNIYRGSRWPSTLVNAGVAALAATIFVWLLQRGFKVPDPQHLRLVLAAIVGGVVGLGGKMLIDEIARQ